MLTQGPAPDPKCGLNITSFFTLPHPLDCPISAKDIMVTVFLLQVMGEWEGWGWFIYLRIWVSYFSYFLFCFCAVVNCSFMART